MKISLPGVEKRMYLAIATVLSVLLVWSMAGSDNAGLESGDRDGDGMADDYEIFYGLNYTNETDAALDYDGDTLSNLAESRPEKLTDPFSPDTDFDGWRDDFDAVISRAYLPFGVPLFTYGDFCEYAHPDFFQGAWKTFGEWFYTAEASGATNQNGVLSGWRVSSSETNRASLTVALDRSILTNNLEYALHYLSASNSSLFFSLLDSNSAVVVDNLYGNLMTGSNGPAIVVLSVPLMDFTNAAAIQLWRGAGAVTVYEGLVYISEDHGELDSDQERQLGTSDYSIDSNGNGIGDYEEWLDSTGGGSSTNPPDGGGGSGSTNNPGGGPGAATGVIYVNQSIGFDVLTGRAPEVRGNDGPKKTISKGLAAVEQDGAHTLIINSGTYGEDLDVRGKGVAVIIKGQVKL